MAYRAAVLFTRVQLGSLVIRCATAAAAAGGVTPAYLSAELHIVGPSKWEESVHMCPCQPPPRPPNPAFLSLITVEHFRSRSSRTLMDRQRESGDGL